MRKLDIQTKILQGTYDPSKERESPSFDSLERSPKCPPHYPPHIQKMWQDRCTDLKQHGYLVKAFLPSLRLLCDWFIIYEEARASVIAGGLTLETEGSKKQMRVIKNPNIDTMHQAMSWIVKLSEKFGFSPLDILKIPPVHHKEKTDKNSLLK
jgi:phage terminase small subunit